MLKIEVHPQVYSELEDARSWYEARAENLGNEFLEEVDRGIQSIKESPTTWSWYDKTQNIRRFFVHRFPYAIIYRVTSSAIQIIAVMHLRRKPEYWEKRVISWPDDEGQIWSVNCLNTVFSQYYKGEFLLWWERGILPAAATPSTVRSSRLWYLMPRASMGSETNADAFKIRFGD